MAQILRAKYPNKNPQAHSQIWKTINLSKNWDVSNLSFNLPSSIVDTYPKPFTRGSNNLARNPTWTIYH